MDRVYHAVPKGYVAPMIYSLNELEKHRPELYKEIAPNEKKDSWVAPGVHINDVINTSTINPAILRREMRAAGWSEGDEEDESDRMYSGRVTRLTRFFAIPFASLLSYAKRNSQRVFLWKQSVDPTTVSMWSKDDEGRTCVNPDLITEIKDATQYAEETSPQAMTAAYYRLWTYARRRGFDFMWMVQKLKSDGGALSDEDMSVGACPGGVVEHADGCVLRRGPRLDYRLA